jgi:dTMP kinase
MQGSLIVIEGTDGSGKSTQFDLMVKRLTAEGYDVATFKFPQYDEPSSYFVREYLNGTYGSADEVGPYTGSLFYALDRFAGAPKIREALDAGKVVLVDRYVGSNMAHQGTKFDRAEERRGYFIWLDNLEFELLRIPRPQMSFVLRVPVNVSKELMREPRQRAYTDKKLDLHEADQEHLERSLQVYDDMCQLFPKDFTRIECTYRDHMLPIETIHEILWRQIMPLLTEKGSAPTPASAPAAATASEVPAETRAAEDHPTTLPAVTDITIPHTEETPGTPEQQTAPEPQSEPTVAESPYSVPEGLSEPAAQQYRAHLDRILELQTEIAAHLTTHFKAAGQSADEAAESAARAVSAITPVASLLAKEGYEPLRQLLHAVPSARVKALSSGHLPQHHDDQANFSVQLVAVQPRNELDALPDALYASSGQSFRSLQTLVSGWPYAQKAALFEAYAKAQPAAFSSISYTWDIVSDGATLATISKQIPSGISLQELSPRYGYAVPEILEEAGVSDRFETCFDLSLGLYSLLQEAGLPVEAQYATLLGHRTRWKITTSAPQFYHLAEALPHLPTVKAMRIQASEAHPLLSSRHA